MIWSENHFVNSFGSVIALKTTSAEAPITIVFFISIFHFLLMLKNKDVIPTEIAEHFNLTLPALSSHLSIFKDANLITEKKQGKIGFIH
jgi:DNA-binding transcriptional ArsR family regulator